MTEVYKWDSSSSFPKQPKMHRVEKWYKDTEYWYS